MADVRFPVQPSTANIKSPQHTSAAPVKTRDGQAFPNTAQGISAGVKAADIPKQLLSIVGKSGLAGTVTVRFTVGKDGKVKNVVAKSGDDLKSISRDFKFNQLANAIAAQLGRINFQPSNTAQTVEVPIILTSE